MSSSVNASGKEHVRLKDLSPWLGWSGTAQTTIPGIIPTICINASILQETSEQETC